MARSNYRSSRGRSRRDDYEDEEPGRFSRQRPQRAPTEVLFGCIGAMLAGLLTAFVAFLLIRIGAAKSGALLLLFGLAQVCAAIVAVKGAPFARIATIGLAAMTVIWALATAGPNIGKSTFLVVAIGANAIAAILLLLPASGAYYAAASAPVRRRREIRPRGGSGGGGRRQVSPPRSGGRAASAPPMPVGGIPVAAPATGWIPPSAVDVVDGIAQSPDGTQAILTLSMGAWPAFDEVVANWLTQKVNGYIGFVKSGGLAEHAPALANAEPVIRMVYSGTIEEATRPTISGLRAELAAQGLGFQAVRQRVPGA